MIEIKVQTDEKKVCELCGKAGVLNASGYSVMAACDKDEVLAFSVFKKDKDSMTVVKIIPEDDILMFDGILRSTLHVAATNGICDVFYTDTLNEKNLEILKFIKNKEKKMLDVDRLFQDSCSCNK